MSVNEERRKRYLYLLAGFPGSGKSTYMARIAKGYPENVILYKHQGNIDDEAFSFLPEKTMENWRQGAAPGAPVKCKIAGKKSGYRKFLQWAILNLKNGLLIVDDCGLFERHILTEEMNDIVTMRRHYGMDVILAYHGLTLLPIEQFVFTNNIIIFNTTDNIQYKANKIPRQEQLEWAIKRARYNHQQPGPTKYMPVVVKMD